MKIKTETDTTKQDTIDVCFLMDATGSMGSWIKQTKENIIQIIDQMKTETPNQVIRLAITAYRDYTDSQLLETFPFSTDYEEFKDFVGKISATGGGDAAEDIFSGIDDALKLDWKSDGKLLIHFADAPCHGKKYHTSYYSDSFADVDHKFELTAEKLFEKMIKMEIDYSFMKITDDTNIMIEEFRKLYDEGNRMIVVKEAKLPKEIVDKERKRMESEGVSEDYISRKKVECKKKGMKDDDIEREESNWRKPSYKSTYVTEELEQLQNMNYQSIVHDTVCLTQNKVQEKKKGWFGF